MNARAVSGCAFALLGTITLIDGVQAATWYIREDGTGDAATIAAGIDSAAVGDTVLVAAGTYPQVWVNKGGIHLIGESGAERTILSGGLDVYTWPRSYDPIEIAGFTATDRMSGDGWPGIFVEGGVAHVHHCVSRGNFGNFTTGGILAYAGSPGDSILVEYNLVTDNGISWMGMSGVGGNVEFRHNTLAGHDYYGIYVRDMDGTPRVHHNIFSGGPEDYGGPFDCRTGWWDAEITCNLFDMHEDDECFDPSIHGFYADPEFCAPSVGDYRLRGESPALAGNHPAGFEDCGQMGAFGVACPSTGIDRVHIVRPSGDGEFPTIEAAVAYADTGDIVLLTDGVFRGLGNRNVYVDKPLTVRSQSGDPHACVIDPQGLPGVGRRAFRLAAAVTLDGLGVVNGRTDGTGGYGGAVLVGGDRASGSIIRGCRFADNQSWAAGAISAVRNGSGAHPTILIENCDFVDNRGDIASAAIDFFQFDAVVRGCRFLRNRSGRGGAIDSETSSLTIEDCVFSENHADGEAGAIGVTRNEAVVRGTVFLRNTATEAGGAIRAQWGATVTMEQVTFTGNEAPRGGAVAIDDAALLMGTTISWDNCAADAPDVFVSSEGSARVACSDVDPEGVRGDDGAEIRFDDDVIAADPEFCLAAACSGPGEGVPDVRLRGDSPCRAEVSPCGTRIGARDVACTTVVGGRRALSPSAQPNPFRARVALMGTTATSRVVVFDAGGRRVRALDALGAGRVEWDGTNHAGHAVPPGVYFAREPLTGRTWRLVRAR